MTKAVIAAILVTLAILQLNARQRQLEPLSGPSPGEPLPTVRVTSMRPDAGTNLTLSSVGFPDKGCHLLLLMSVHCIHCSRMRYTWQETYRAWSDSVGEDIQTTWVFRQGLSAARRFVENFDLQGVTVVSLGDDAARSWKRLGVIGTPMSYLVSEAGDVYASRLGPGLPSAVDAREICAGG